MYLFRHLPASRNGSLSALYGEVSFLHEGEITAAATRAIFRVTACVDTILSAQVASFTKATRQLKIRRKKSKWNSRSWPFSRPIAKCSHVELLELRYFCRLCKPKNRSHIRGLIGEANFGERLTVQPSGDYLQLTLVRSQLPCPWLYRPQHDLWGEVDLLSLTRFFLPFPFLAVSSCTGGQTLFKICWVRRVKAWSTFSLESALVSTCWTPWFWASSCPLSLVTCRLLARSHLFATRILSTSSFACSSIFLIHFEMLLKVFSLVTSYTSMIPRAPR